MQQYPYGGSQPPQFGGLYGVPPPTAPQPPKKPSAAPAAISVAFGLFALFVPVAVLDVVLGVAGIVLASLALRSGVKALAVAGMVLSIMGTYEAIFFTAGRLGQAQGEWVLTLQSLIR
ncbi:MAG: hypothetical protein FWE19_02170 [Oscillospiraceae bacterium]|nr:hypothetical protein [Oscillospiraceae bacterium]